MKEITDVVALYNKLIQGLDLNKEHPEKFIGTLLVADEANYKFLNEQAIRIKPNAWSVLSLPNMELQKRVLRAKELGFIDAYMQSAAFLKQDVDTVIKRMGQLEHLGIPYKNEKGKYLAYLFSERGYNYIVNEKTKGDIKSGGDTPRIENIELKELADRVMETLVITNSADVYQEIAELEKKSLKPKEILMEVFKKYDKDLNHLSEVIDDIISFNNNLAKGRA